MKTIVFDLDGTLAGITHRLHFIKDGNHDWDGFFAACVDDAPIPEMIALFQQLRRGKEIGYNSLVIVSGRSDQVYDQTVDWLHKHNIMPDRLHMRREGDHRPDYKVKEEIFHMMVSQGHEILLAFDDRQQVVDMWRSNGIRCAQVAKGDF